MTRLEANREIIKLLSEFIEKHPDQRFGQAIENISLISIANEDYYAESDVILKEMRERLRELGK